MMRKIFLLALMLFVAAVAAQAADRTGHMMRDKSLTQVPGPSPNGILTQDLTVNSTTVDTTGSLWYAAFSNATTCKVRLMPTSAKGTYKRFPAPSGVWTEGWVNKDTPFLNLSGCTNGSLRRQ